MKDLLEFLAHGKRYWVPPILIAAAVIAFLAWKSSQAGVDSPFSYDTH